MGVDKENFVGIHIHLNEKLNLTVRNLIKSVFWGIEEEGIPYHIFEGKNIDSDELGYEASKISRLGVGIGIDDNYITLYYEKLKLGEALFKYETSAEEYKLRSLGTNAARLIKGDPFIIKN